MWISVKDKLPEMWTLVLVHDSFFHKSDKHYNDKEFKGTVYRPEGVRFGYICSSGFRVEGVNGLCDITHWQPLPEPPEE